MIRSKVLTQITGVTSNSDGPDSDGPDFDGPGFDRSPILPIPNLMKKRFAGTSLNASPSLKRLLLLT